MSEMHGDHDRRACSYFAHCHECDWMGNVGDFDNASDRAYDHRAQNSGHMTHFTRTCPDIRQPVAEVTSTEVDPCAKIAYRTDLPPNPWHGLVSCQLPLGHSGDHYDSSDRVGWRAVEGSKPTEHDFEKLPF